MGPPIPNPWTTEPDYIDLLNYVIQKAKDAKSPINIRQLGRDFKKTSGATQTDICLQRRIRRMRARICSFKHIDKKEKVKLLFALSAPIDTKFLKELKKDALVEVDHKKRIKKYEAIDGSLEFNGDHSHTAKMRPIMAECKYSLRTLIINYFETKGNADAIPMSQEEKEMKNLIEFITEKCENVDSPLNIQQLTEDFNEKCGISRSSLTIRYRIKGYCREIQKLKFLDTSLKVKQLFGLSATVDSDYLEKLRKDATVEVDGKNRITNYKSKDGSFELRGDHSVSAKNRTARIESKGTLRSLISDHFESKNDSNAVPNNDGVKEMGNLIEFITEKCENADSPLRLHQLANDFKCHYGISRSAETICARIKAYCREIQRLEFLDTHSKVKQLFGLSAKVDLDCLEKLRKNALVEVDHKNRIIKYMANDNSLTLRGGHWGSGETTPKRVKKTMKDNVVTTADDSEKESDNEVFNDSSDAYSCQEFDSEFDADEENEENDLLDETKNLTEPSNEADNLDNDTPVRNYPPTEISIGDNFDFDPPTERSEKIEMRKDDEKDDPEITENAAVKPKQLRIQPEEDPEDDRDDHCSEEFDSEFDSDDENDFLDKPKDPMEPPNEADETPVRNRSPVERSIDNNFDFDSPTERSHRSEEIEMREDVNTNSGITGNAAVKPKKLVTLPKNKISSSTSCTSKTPKRKTDASAGSSTSKRTKPLPEESMNLEELGDNFSNDDPPRIELNPFHGPHGLPNETQKDSEVQQIPKSHPQVMEAPIKEEYEEETQTLLKMVLNAYKSLILSLDTPGLSQLQMELNKKIKKAGRRSDVSTEEVIMAMNFLMIKLSKHGAPKSSEDSISLRDTFLMLRTIILNSSFNGLEVILEMLKKNIEQLKVLDKKVPVSKVDSVLRASLDIICT
ncbi:unnamed protein product [Caenorhabditis brenneri]